MTELKNKSKKVCYECKGSISDQSIEQIAGSASAIYFGSLYEGNKSHFRFLPHKIIDCLHLREQNLWTEDISGICGHRVIEHMEQLSRTFAKDYQDALLNIIKDNRAYYYSSRVVLKRDNGIPLEEAISPENPALKYVYPPRIIITNNSDTECNQTDILIHYGCYIKRQPALRKHDITDIYENSEYIQRLCPCCQTPIFDQQGKAAFDAIMRCCCILTGKDDFHYFYTEEWVKKGMLIYIFRYFNRGSLLVTPPLEDFEDDQRPKPTKPLDLKQFKENLSDRFNEIQDIEDFKKLLSDRKIEHLERTHDNRPWKTERTIALIEAFYYFTSTYEGQKSAIIAHARGFDLSVFESFEGMMRKDDELFEGSYEWRKSVGLVKTKMYLNKNTDRMKEAQKKQRERYFRNDARNYVEGLGKEPASGQCD